MTGPQLKTPALFLLLLQLSTLTGTAFCEESSPPDVTTNSSSSQVTISTHLTATGSNGLESDPTTSPPDETDESGSGETSTSIESSSKMLHVIDSPEPEDSFPIVIGAAVAGIIIGAIIIVGVVIWRRCSKKAGNQEFSKEDPHLDGPSSEKVPMPMFEEDVPSVLELEMDELDQWMKKES